MAQVWATPPPGFVEVPGNRMSRKTSLQDGGQTPWCPACKQDAGRMSAGMGFQDAGAQAFDEKHWKNGGYDGGCKMFEGDMIKSHKSRWAMWECMTCGCEFWHNWDSGYDKNNKYHAIKNWYRPKAARTLSDFLTEGGGVR